MRALRRLAITFVVCLGLGASSSARADWIVYLSGEMGTTSATTQTAGTNVVSAPTPLILGGVYSDSSPLISGAVGLAIPLDESMAWELPYGIRLPHWPLRFEMEATGLRSFEGIVMGTNPLDTFASTDSWSIMFDFWQDVPMGGLNRPLSRLFGRSPRWLVELLDHSTFFAGAGIGVNGLDFRYTDTFHVSQGDTINFAWQVGSGFGYELTDAVTLNLGYRYFDYGEVATDLLDTADRRVGPFFLGQSSHEFRFGLRFNVWGFHNPWH